MDTENEASQHHTQSKTEQHRSPRLKSPVFTDTPHIHTLDTIRYDHAACTRSNRKQESLANAKVSARQPCNIGRNSLNRPSPRNAQQYQRHLYIVENCIQCATIPSLTVPVYLHLFSRCCLEKVRSSAKFRYAMLRSLRFHCRIVP